MGLEGGVGVGGARPQAVQSHTEFMIADRPQLVSMRWGWFRVKPQVGVNYVCTHLHEVGLCEAPLPPTAPPDPYTARPCHPAHRAHPATANLTPIWRHGCWGSDQLGGCHPVSPLSAHICPSPDSYPTLPHPDANAPSPHATFMPLRSPPHTTFTPLRCPPQAGGLLGSRPTGRTMPCERST